MAVRDSQIFSPFRAVGYVANHVPLYLEARGSDHFVTTAVGNSFHVYNCKNLKLQCVGDVGEPIKVLLCVDNITIISSGSSVSTYKRGKKIGSYDDHVAEVLYALSFGGFVTSIDCKNNIHVWSHETFESHLTFSLNPEEFQVTACIHPSTYLNKILLGSKQGNLQLWNIRTYQLIYEFKGWKEEVNVLEQSPAVDVIGVGLQSGRVVLLNIKYEKSLMSFYQDFGLVTCISFRTDGAPIMATGSPDGTISFWNLEKKQSVHIERNAHKGSVSGLKFLQRQPLLVTSGPDNSLQIWIFDNPDGSCRLLRSRSGHNQPPTNILFYGSYGNAILTTGMDRALRYTAIMRGEQCHEFSQGSLIKKSKSCGFDVDKFRLPPITCMAAEPSKEKDWDNVVTCHLGFPAAVTWNTLKKSIGKHKLKSDITSNPTAVDISSCGNYTVVGYQNGGIQKFNLQSGISRGKFLKSVSRHSGAVKGVSIDSVNLTLVSASADKKIKFWNFKEETLIDEIQCNCSISKSKLHRESSLLAVCFEDYFIKVYDIDTKHLIRQFYGHEGIITDICWSSDARWLCSSSMDGTIKTWDLPSARLIDCFLVDYPAVSVALSPRGEFLVTTHQDNVGIYLWANKLTYTGVYPTPLPEDYQPTVVSLPTTQIEGEEMGSVQAEDAEEIPEPDSVYESPEQIASPLVTLSMLPDSRWKTLINLDLIKERNKPKKPPEKPKAAPFFLPTVSGLQTAFDLTKNDKTQREASTVDSKIRRNDFDMVTSFQKLLQNEPYCLDEILSCMKNMSPSEIDVELRTLGPDAGGSVQLLCAAVKMFMALLKTGKGYEMIQAFIALFLKLHGELICKEAELRSEAGELLDALKCSWIECDELVNKSTCLIKYFKSATV